jgi:hypothetical protein
MRRRSLRRRSVSLSIILAVAASLPVANASAAIPDRIPLPRGSQPEGLAISSDGSFFTGSIADGTIYEGDIETGDVHVFAPGGAGRSALGIEARRGLVWVAGGETGKAWVYRRNGQLIRTYDFDPGGFVNDVVVTKRAAYFTDSFEPFLYRVPIVYGEPVGRAGVEARPLSGDIAYEDGFNANGIDVDRGRSRFVMAQLNTGELFVVRPSGHTREIDLHGKKVRSGDGVVLKGHIVYVVQNFLNKIAKVRLSDDLRRGRVRSRTRDADFDVPTSVDLFDGGLYVVNARFTTPATPDTRYWIAGIPRP